MKLTSAGFNKIRYYLDEKIVDTFPDVLSKSASFDEWIYKILINIPEDNENDIDLVSFCNNLYFEFIGEYPNFQTDQAFQLALDIIEKNKLIER